MTDEQWMKRALDLALKSDNRIQSNPKVGCVIVKKNQIIAEGYHEIFGEAHAEIIALERANQSVEGATLYVNLEPCSHFGKTPPCCQRIVEEGISRVVIGIQDPNPKVSGRGISYLEEHGVEVTLGVLEKESKEINRIFLHYIKTGLPYVFLKAAMSLDGKIATRTGESQWISGEESRALSHRWRSEYQSIAVGSGTVIIDDPRLTSRGENLSHPIRILLDSSFKISTRAKLFQEPGKTILFHCKEDPEKEKILKTYPDTEVLKISSKDGKIDLLEMLKFLGSIGISSIMVEGGPTLFDSFFKEGLVNEGAFFIAPMIIGGKDGKSMVEGEGIQSLKEAFHFDQLNSEQVGRDLLIRVRKEDPCLQE